MHTHKQEKGQILVLFVLGLVGLLGLTALAIDGSMVYSDRRFDQSVADSAALAGATAASDIINGLSNQLFHCGDSAVITAMNNALYAAQTRAANNGFTGATALALQDLSTQHGVYVTCNDSVKPKYLAVEVHLSSETATSFAHLVFGQDKIRNTVTSVVYLYPQRPVAAGYAIVGMHETCNAVEYDGNITNIVNGGGVFSNGGITKNGSSGYMKADSWGTVKANCGNHDYTGDGDLNDGINVSGAPTIVGSVHTNQPEISIYLPEIDCNSIPAATFDPTTNTWSKGRHPGFKVNNNEVVHLAPGLHCLTSGIQATAKGKLFGSEVTLYFQNGSFDGNGKGQIELSAPTTEPGNIIDGMQGVVIYIDPDNTGGEVDMQGTSDAKYTGTVYVPNGHIDFGGTSGTAPTYTTQFIGRTVKMHGTPEVTINYDESAFAREPASLDQIR